MPLGQPENHVVLVHGLWFGGWSLSLLKRRLARAGFRIRTFSYSSTHQDIGAQIQALYRFALGPDDRLPHLVAHSMGGLIALRMLAGHPDTPSGRVVLMGSPVSGSSVARRVSAWPGARLLLGAAESTLIEGIEDWPDGREIGMITGTRSLGLGLFAGSAGQKSDGTVLAEESRHDGLDDHIEIPATHTTMLLSAEVARQAIMFLREGRFDH